MSKFATLAGAVSAACAATLPLHAQEAAPLTRAQVVADLREVIGSGQLNVLTGEDSGSFWLSRQPQAATLTRARVRAEVAATLARGDLPSSAGEDSALMLERMARGGLMYAGPSVGARHEPAPSAQANPG